MGILSIIGIAFIWMLIETDFMRVRLPYGSSNKRALAEIVHANLSITDNEPEIPDVKLLNAGIPILQINTVKINYKPAVFIQSEIPTLDGELNISCKLEG